MYDDDSSDATYAVCASYAGAHSGFSVIKGGKLPGGWTGKNYACHQLSKQANGEYFLFVDADEIINNGLINSAVYRMRLYKISLLSLFANQVMPTFGENTTVPLLHYMLLSLLPLRLVYLIKNPSFSVACGQFMLFDAATYRENEWHKQAKSQVVEDAEIMRLVKRASYNGEVLLANGMINCRMYRNYKQAINGFSKNALAVFNYSIPGLLIFILLLIGGSMIVFMTFSYHLIFFMVSLIILSRVMISLSAGQNPWYNILLHPLQMINLVIIAFLSIQRHLTNTNMWKGRRV